jgi:hypothetical protein
MRAKLRFRERFVLSDTEFAELVVWLVDPPVRGSLHPYKYRLAFVCDNRCVLRFDNEAGKGDHMHIDDEELSYTFIDEASLRADFWKEVRRWKLKH